MDDDLRRLLDDFSPEVQHLATSVRARIFELVPAAQEKVMRGYNSLSYGFASGMKEQFSPPSCCTVSASICSCTGRPNCPILPGCWKGRARLCAT